MNSKSDHIGKNRNRFCFVFVSSYFLFLFVLSISQLLFFRSKSSIFFRFFFLFFQSRLFVSCRGFVFQPKYYYYYYSNLKARTNTFLLYYYFFLVCSFVGEFQNAIFSTTAKKKVSFNIITYIYIFRYI